MPLTAGLTVPLLGSTPVPLTVYSHPVRYDSETMFSFTIVFVCVEDETTPWLKFGTTGTAAAGDAKSSNSALAALQFTDHLPDGAGVGSTWGNRDGPSRGDTSAQTSVSPCGCACDIAKGWNLTDCWRRGGH